MNHQFLTKLPLLILGPIHNFNVVVFFYLDDTRTLDNSNSFKTK